MDWKVLIEMLGSDNVEAIKKTVTQEIINDIHESASAEWFVLPSQFEEMFDELSMEVFEEVKKKYKKELKDVTCKKMEEFIASMSVNEVQTEQ